MTTTHQMVDFYAGDDWEIRATLLDENGDPYDLAAAPTIEWVLLDSRSQRVLNGADVTISVTDAAAGKCAIQVPATATSPLATGSYTDMLRITAGGVTSTLAVGPIHVVADAFK
jgi:hypothetical protein